LSVSAPSVTQPPVRHPGYRAGSENVPYEFKAGPAGGRLRRPSSARRPHNGHQGTDPTVSQADELAAGPYHVVLTGHPDLVVIRWSCESTEPSGGKTRTANERVQLLPDAATTIPNRWTTWSEAVVNLPPVVQDGSCTPIRA
jgi:hypothetical protein